MKNHKPILFIDLDEVLADFSKAAPELGPAEMYVPGFFADLDVVPGAKLAVRQLYRSGKFDIQILSVPVSDSPESYTEKARWVATHFPYLLNKINLTQDKGLFKGDYLIDDNLKWQNVFGGEFLHFDVNNPCQSWKKMVKYLLNADADKLCNHGKTKTTWSSAGRNSTVLTTCANCEQELSLIAF